MADVRVAGARISPGDDQSLLVLYDPRTGKPAAIVKPFDESASDPSYVLHRNPN